MITRHGRRGLLLGLILLAGVGCARRGSGESVSVPQAPSGGLAPALLVVDLASRADRDLLPLLGEEGREGLYEVRREGPQWVLGAAAVGSGSRPTEIRAVDSGLLSRRGLLELGELDAADLAEGDLEAGGSGRSSPVRILRFPDYERLVLRFGPEMSADAAASLSTSLDREALAALIFERSGRPAGACLPGEPDRLGEAASGGPTPGQIRLLVEEGRPELWAVAERIARDWDRVGVSTVLASLPRGAVRDRLGRGRFEAALLTLTRDASGAREAAAALARSGWACAPPPSAEVDAEAGLERWFRETCRIFPLLSLDRVVGLRQGLEGIAFDGVGRIDWSLARVAEES